MQKDVDAGDVAQAWQIIRNAVVTDAVLVFVVAADLLTKRFLFVDAPSFSFLGGFIRQVHHENTGITFDLPLPLPVTIAITMAVLVAIALALWRAWSRKRWSISVPLALIAGGAIGNLYDRLTFGYVRDWLLLWGRSAVNVADLAIVGGLLWYFLKTREKRPELTP
jgi:signal peptidase II